MSRLWGMGFELNSTTALVEFTSVTGAGCTIQTSIVRSGTYAGRVTTLVSATRMGFGCDFATPSNGPYYWRIAIYIATLPSAANTIMIMTSTNSISGTVAQSLTLDNTGVLRLYNAGVQVGSDSPALGTGQWYVVEGWYDKSPAAGSQVMKARINGNTEFASATNLTIANQVTTMFVGANLAAEAQTVGDIYYDDITINDSAAGAGQTSYPGLSKIILAFPDAAGDNAAMTIGGSAPAATNWQGVIDNPPDDGVTFNSSKVLNAIDDHQISCPAAIRPSDTINCVGHYLRYSGAGASANSTIRARIKSAASGTVGLGNGIAPTNATWVTNTNTRSTFRYVSYTDPTTGVAWTPTGTNSIDSAQVGYEISVASTNNARASAVAVVIDYTSNRGIVYDDRRIRRNVLLRM